jgi:hypothetical protein
LAIRPRSATDVVEADVVDVQILGTLVAAMYALHLQLLLDATDRGACPPWAAEADKGAECPLSCNNPCSATLLWCTPTSSRDMQIRMCVFHAVSMSKMVGIRPKHALPPGKVQITRRGLIGTMQANTLQQGTMGALRRCTKVSCLICDGAGQSR